MNKLQMAEQLRRALQIFAASLDDEKALEVATLYEQWTPGKAYAAGELIAYGKNSAGDPQLYRVAQGHTSQADWTPDNSAALFSSIGLDGSGYPIWSQPSGAHDAYGSGDIVSYNGALYRSLIDGNIWTPDAYPEGWESYKEE